MGAHCCVRPNIVCIMHTRVPSQPLTLQVILLQFLCQSQRRNAIIKALSGFITSINIPLHLCTECMYDIEGYAYSVHECMYIVDVIYAHIGCIYRFLMTVAKTGISGLGRLFCVVPESGCFFALLVYIINPDPPSAQGITYSCRPSSP